MHQILQVAHAHTEMSPGMELMAIDGDAHVATVVKFALDLLAPNLPAQPQGPMPELPLLLW